MDFLKTLALPQSLQHYRLVIFMMAVITPLLVSYTGAMVGASGLSLWFLRRGKESQDREFLRDAQRLMGFVLPDKGTPVLLGIIPVWAIMFLSAQVLQGTSSIGISAWLAAAVCLSIGIGLLYAYRFAFRLGNILTSYEGLVAAGSESSGGEDVVKYHKTMDASGWRAGTYGLVFSFLALFFIAAAMELTTNPVVAADVDSFFVLVLSINVWLQTIILFVMALGMTGTLILSRIPASALHEENGTDEHLARIALRFSLLSLLVLPLLLIAKILILPEAALSGWLFAACGAGILLLFAAGHAIYARHREGGQSCGLVALLLFIGASTSMLTADQLIMNSATQEHAVALSVIHEKVMEELRSRLGIVLVKLTGDDIYNAKCSACHLFDQKKVGPPYLTVLPKYQGKKAQLISFILNPQKVNPAYPAMPNQGLKPAEADSIAGFILRKAGIKP